jgi:hypothetical protein
MVMATASVRWPGDEIKGVRIERETRSFVTDGFVRLGGKAYDVDFEQGLK